MTDSVVTSPSGISEGSCVKLSIYQACVHRFQDKRTTLKNPPSNLQQGEPVLSLFMPSWRSVLGEMKLTRWGITSPKIHPPPRRILPLAPCTSLSFCLSPLPHCTACSLAVLPESWGFMTSGSSGGVEKDSILSCSNVSSERTTRNRKWQRCNAREERSEQFKTTCSAQTELGAVLMREVDWRVKYLPLRRKANPTVAGAWGRAVWFVKPQFPRVCPSLSITSSWRMKFLKGLKSWRGSCSLTALLSFSVHGVQRVRNLFRKFLLGVSQILRRLIS